MVGINTEAGSSTGTREGIDSALPCVGVVHVRCVSWVLWMKAVDSQAQAFWQPMFTKFTVIYCSLPLRNLHGIERLLNNSLRSIGNSAVGCELSVVYAVPEIAV